MSKRLREEAEPAAEEKEEAEEAEEADTCGICLAPFHGSPTIRVCDNSHVYHRDCVAQWFKKQDSCPACRSKVDLSLLTQLLPRPELHGRMVNLVRKLIVDKDRKGFSDVLFSDKYGMENGLVGDLCEVDGDGRFCLKETPSCVSTMSILVSSIIVCDDISNPIFRAVLKVWNRSVGMEIDGKKAVVPFSFLKTLFPDFKGVFRMLMLGQRVYPLALSSRSVVWFLNCLEIMKLISHAEMVTCMLLCQLTASGTLHLIQSAAEEMADTGDRLRQAMFTSVENVAERCHARGVDLCNVVETLVARAIHFLLGRPHDEPATLGPDAVIQNTTTALVFNGVAWMPPLFHKTSAQLLKHMLKKYYTLVHGDTDAAKQHLLATMTKIRTAAVAVRKRMYAHQDLMLASGIQQTDAERYSRIGVSILCLESFWDTFWAEDDSQDIESHIGFDQFMVGQPEIGFFHAGTSQMLEIMNSSVEDLAPASIQTFVHAAGAEAIRRTTSNFSQEMEAVDELP